MKEERQENQLERLSSVRRNLINILHYGNVTPFIWTTKGFRCFYCKKEIQEIEQLKQHTATKHATLDLEEFIQHKIVSKDVPVKIDVSQLGCKACPEDLPTIDELTQHIAAVHGEDYDHSARTCVFPFILTNDILTCLLCNAQYDNYLSLISHMHKEHIVHSYVCQICGLSFLFKYRMLRHIRNKHVGFKCTDCGKMFDSNLKVERHKELFHGKVKTHECSLCSEKFQNDYQVKVHMGKVHNVEKYRIKCELCPKICTTKGAMVLHVQSIHSDVKYQCDLCDYKAGIKWVVKLHRRKHFGEKNYECNLCGRKFGRSSSLRTHMKVHTGKFGRVCRWCRKGFADSETMNVHMTEAHYTQYD